MAKTNNSLHGLRDMLFAQLEAITNPDIAKAGIALAKLDVAARKRLNDK